MMTAKKDMMNPPMFEAEQLEGQLLSKPLEPASAILPYFCPSFYVYQSRSIASIPTRNTSTNAIHNLANIYHISSLSHIQASK